MLKSNPNMKKKFSYSSNELSKPKQFIINSIEKISGRKKLEKLYQQYNEEDSKPHLFWTDVKNLLKLKFYIALGEDRFFLLLNFHVQALNKYCFL